MSRLGAIIVVLSMVLIAASAGAVSYLFIGLRAAEAMTVAVAVLTGLAIYNAVSTRMRDRTDLGTQIADLSRGTADLARQVAELTRRTETVEGQTSQIAGNAETKIRSATEPLTAELGELGTLVKQLAQTVASHELKFTNVSAAAPAPRPPQDTQRLVEEPPPAPAPNTSAAARANMIETVRNAIEGDRVDLYLQPVVALPQRKVRYYEAFARLRTENGTLVQPADFMEAAEAAGLMPRIDRLILFRSVQVIRRLQIKNREVGLFCNVGASTLNDPAVLPEILQFMDANRAIAPSLILEFKQATLRSMGPLEVESLAALREAGFRFCMDGVADLRMDPRDLGERGIRYVKVPAALLLGEAAAAGSDIHAADLSDLLGRFGISLIAERIEAEAQVVDLLEYDVRFGQGFLFSPPRPVRAEALRGAAEAIDPSSDIVETPRRMAAGRGPGIIH